MGESHLEVGVGGGQGGRGVRGRGRGGRGVRRRGRGGRGVRGRERCNGEGQRRERCKREGAEGDVPVGLFISPHCSLVLVLLGVTARALQKPKPSADDMA